MFDHLITDAGALGKVIRERRRALGMRQADLAMVAGVGVRFIVDAENGKSTCQIGLLLKLLRELGIDLAASVPSATETHLPSGGIEIEGYEL
ncbi:helix-turn-helix domain-containing protein [Skermanella rosea]|uniref:helix-turn-helix domain-containing protein n=1 Tax=Skermanella rosea TaxID=1817965 RepID=UPI0019332E55|nr:helix-turn-helix domain-containing protein [Skermanella rosea]UEM03359.1 helix-turn-helix domain-containing protein [Skermanella rosea]